MAWRKWDPLVPEPGRFEDNQYSTPCGSHQPSTGWWRYGDSNPRPRHCERRALPTELYPRKRFNRQDVTRQKQSSKNLVGITGVCPPPVSISGAGQTSVTKPLPVRSLSTAASAQILPALAGVLANRASRLTCNRAPAPRAHRQIMPRRIASSQDAPGAGRRCPRASSR